MAILKDSRVSQKDKFQVMQDRDESVYWLEQEAIGIKKCVSSQVWARDYQRMTGKNPNEMFKGIKIDPIAK
jgi:hypothetical protein